MSFSLQRNNLEVEREDQFADPLSVILFKEVILSPPASPSKATSPHWPQSAASSALNYILLPLGAFVPGSL